MGKSSVLLNTPRFSAIKEINEKSPNWIKKHSDPDYTEIIYIQQGCGEFIFEKRPFIGQEGDLIMIQPFSQIEVKSNTDDPFKGIYICVSNLHINGNDKGWLTKSNDFPIIHLQEEKMEIDNYLKVILREFQMKHAGYQDVISSILQAAIIKITRLLKDSDHQSVSPGCFEVKKFIEENFRQELTLNDLANLVYVSPYHLAHIFKEEVGMPPIQYLIQCRIEEAKRLLKNSNLSVKEIAAMIGYENPNYFNLLFKKVTGTPPGKYRKSEICSKREASQSLEPSMFVGRHLINTITVE
ncbi:AraC family transcriptional regulator [Neobacillus cucumis]|uniref:AraC family transcriptional regulator n=1 Tax=Neobacillus cucumis TaxID=1740721 RepID=UPI002E1D5C56|nr:helix-turn-helix domain-containing protein [Neobacillus cucumis]MED4226217.1 helix-turn-helix domain-containing protein [Neobacillus cucumis]